MTATVSLDSIWSMLQSLSTDNQKWLANKLHEEIERKKGSKKELVFPHRPANKEISPEVKAMVNDRLPVDIDVEQEREKMWEEWAK